MKQEICDVMKECYSRGWITTRDGNCSARDGGKDFMYITPSGHRKNVLDREDLVRIDFSEGQLIVSPGRRPSGELHMHYLLQQAGRVTRTVLHAHPTHVIAAMYRGFDLQVTSSQFPEIFRYTKVGSTVPPIPAVTPELGEVTADYFALIRGKDSIVSGEVSYDIVGQANHGVTSVGEDPWHAFEHIERLDHICQIILASGVSPAEVLEKITLG
jgi:ribulose-5-phosphate 4-epimerase/fuculose-1-phosphate aldolase